MMKKMVLLGMILGSLAGGYIPLIWGESAFSMSSVIFSGVGALLGIWIGYKIGMRLD
jgi:hypothetical protein